MKRRMLSISFCILAVLIMSGALALQTQQRQLSEKLIRLHVVARSDSEHDQEVKLSVRDAVLARTREILDGCDDPRGALQGALTEIEAAAQEQLKSLGEDENVTVRLGKELFPTRDYETFSLPAGVYESLRVTIGEGAGHNWWCVVFPSICLTASMDELEQAAQTAGFTDSEIKLITEADDGFVLKFKLVELIQKLKNFLTDT